MTESTAEKTLRGFVVQIKQFPLDERKTLETETDPPPKVSKAFKLVFNCQVVSLVAAARRCPDSLDGFNG